MRLKYVSDLLKGLIVHKGYMVLSSWNLQPNARSGPTHPPPIVTKVFLIRLVL